MAESPWLNDPIVEDDKPAEANTPWARDPIVSGPSAAPERDAAPWDKDPIIGGVSASPATPQDPTPSPTPEPTPAQPATPIAPGIDESAPSPTPSQPAAPRTGAGAAPPAQRPSMRDVAQAARTQAEGEAKARTAAVQPFKGLPNVPQQQQQEAQTPSATPSRQSVIGGEPEAQQPPQSIYAPGAFDPYTESYFGAMEEMALSPEQRREKAGQDMLRRQQEWVQEHGTPPPQEQQEIWRQRYAAEAGLPSPQQPDADAEVRGALLEGMPMIGKTAPTRAVASGLLGVGMEGNALFMRGLEAAGIPTPEGMGADDFIESSSAMSRGLDLSNEDAWTPDIISRGIEGATRSLSQVLLTRGGGSPTVIGGFMLMEGNRALTEGRKEGLRGADLYNHALNHAAIEGVVTSAFQKIGLGGLERLGRSPLKQGLKQGIMTGLKRAGIQTAGELSEEVLVELGHKTEDYMRGIDPDTFDPERMKGDMAQLATTTLITMGASEGGRGVATAEAGRQRRQRKQEVDAIRQDRAAMRERQQAEQPAQPPEAPAPDTAESPDAPDALTAQLRERGHTDQQIQNMSPDQVQAALAEPVQETTQRPQDERAQDATSGKPEIQLRQERPEGREVTRPEDGPEGAQQPQQGQQQEALAGQEQAPAPGAATQARRGGEGRFTVQQTEEGMYQVVDEQGQPQIPAVTEQADAQAVAEILGRQDQARTTQTQEEADGPQPRQAEEAGPGTQPGQADVEVPGRARTAPEVVDRAEDAADVQRQAVEAFAQRSRQTSGQADLHVDAVEPESETDQLLRDEGESAGFELVFAEGRDADGNPRPLPFAASFNPSNPRRLIVERGNTEGVARGLVMHEVMGHVSRRTDPAIWEGLYDRLQRRAGGELANALEQYRQEYAEAGGRAEDVQGEVAREEAVASLAQNLASEVVNGRLTAESLAEAVQDMPRQFRQTLVQRFMDAIERVMRRVGLRSRETRGERVERVNQRLLDRSDVRRQQAEAITAFRDSFEQLTGFRPEQGPGVRQPAETQQDATEPVVAREAAVDESQAEPTRTGEPQAEAVAEPEPADAQLQRAAGTYLEGDTAPVQQWLAENDTEYARLDEQLEQAELEGRADDADAIAEQMEDIEIDRVMETAPPEAIQQARAQEGIEDAEEAPTEPREAAQGVEGKAEPGAATAEAQRTAEPEAAGPPEVGVHQIGGTAYFKGDAVTVTTAPYELHGGEFQDAETAEGRTVTIPTPRSRTQRVQQQQAQRESEQAGFRRLQSDPQHQRRTELEAMTKRDLASRLKRAGGRPKSSMTKADLVDRVMEAEGQTQEAPGDTIRLEQEVSRGTPEAEAGAAPGSAEAESVRPAQAAEAVLEQASLEENAKQRFSRKQVQERLSESEPPGLSTTELVEHHLTARDAQGETTIEPTFGFGGKVPTEVKEALEGVVPQPQVNQIVKGNVEGGQAEDFIGQLDEVFSGKGMDTFIDMVVERAGGASARAQRNQAVFLENPELDPQLALEAWVNANRPREYEMVTAYDPETGQPQRTESGRIKKRRRPTGVTVPSRTIDPNQLPDGAEFSIYGEPFIVETNEQGDRVLAHGETQFEVPLDGIEAAPMDEGSLEIGESDAAPTTGAQPAQPGLPGVGPEGAMDGGITGAQQGLAPERGESEADRAERRFREGQTERDTETGEMFAPNATEGTPQQQQEEDIPGGGDDDQPMPANAEKFGVTQQDVRTASAYTEDQPSAEFTKGVKDFLAGRSNVQRVDGMTKAEANTARQGFKAAQQGASQATQEDVQQTRERTEERESDGETGALFAVRRGDRLKAIHNMSAEQLVRADRLGGLAMPSVAVTKQSIPLDKYGDVTLIGDRNLIDPDTSRVRVFDSDIYSPTMPRPDWKVSRKAVDAMADRHRQAFEDAEDANTLISDIWDRVVNATRPDRQRVLEEAQRSRGMKLAYLREQGEDVRVPTKPEPVQTAYVHEPGLMRWYQEHRDEIRRLEEQGGQDLMENPLWREFSQQVNRAIDRYAAQEAGGDAELRDTIRDALKHDMTMDGRQPNFEDDGRLLFAPGNRILRDLGKAQAGRRVVDTEAMEDRLDRKLRSRRQAYEQWVEDQIDPIFTEARIQLGNRKVPYTLENAVKAMQREALQAGEDNLTFGPGAARASGAREFRSVQEMRDDKGRLVTSDQFSQASKAQEEAREAFQELIVNKYKHTVHLSGGPKLDTFGALDDSMRAVGEYLKRTKSPSPSVMRRALLRHDFENVTEKDAEAGVRFAEQLRGTPTQYFEAKLPRGVDIGEFKAAVIPENADPQVRQVLDKHGVPYRPYNPKRKGSRDFQTRRAIADSEQRGEEVIFAAGRRKPTKTRIREATGQTKDDIPKISERKALKGKLQAEQRSAKRAANEARRTARAEAKENLARLKNELRADKDAAQAIRNRLTAMVNENLPKSVRGEFTTTIRDGDTPAKLYSGMRRVEKALAEHEHKLAVNRLKKALDRINPKKMRPEFQAKVQEATGDVDLQKMTGKTRRRLVSAAKFLEENEDARSHLDKRTLEGMKRLSKRSVAEMKAEEIDEITRAVQLANHLNRTKNVLIGKRRGRAREEARKQIVGEVERLKKPLRNPIRNMWRKTIGKPAVAPRRGAVSWIAREWAARPQDVAESISPTLSNMMFEDIGVEGHRQEQRVIWDNRDSLRAEFERAGHKMGTRAFEKWRNAPVEVETENGPVKFTRDEVMWLLGQIKDPTNKGYILRNGYTLTRLDKEMRFTDTQLDALETKKGLEVERRIAQHMFERMNGPMKRWLNDAWVEAFGYGVANVPSYFPRKVDLSRTDTQTDPLEMMSQSQESTLMSWGHLRERQGTAAPIEGGSALDGYLNHTEHVARVSSYLVPMQNIHAVLGEKRVKQSILQRWGKSGYERMLDAIRMQVVRPRDMGDAERFMRRQMRRYAAGILGLRWTTLGLNPSGIFIAGSDAGFGRMGRAWLTSGSTKAASEWKRVGRLAQKHSPYWRSRYENFTHELTGGMTPDLSRSYGRPGISELSLRPLQWSDRYGATIRWRMAELKVKEEQTNLEEGSDAFYEEVAKEWERLMYRSENTGHGMEMSFAVAMGRKNPLAAPLSIFQSSVSKIYSGLLRARNQAQQGEGSKAAKSLAGVLLAVGWATALREFASEMRGGGSDDEDLTKRLGSRYLTEMAGLMPVFGPIGQRVIRHKMGQSTWAPGTLYEEIPNNAFQTIAGLDRSIDAWWNEKVDSDGETVAMDELIKAGDRASDLMAQMFGTPTMAPKDIYRMAKNSLSGTEPDTRLEAMRMLRQSREQDASAEGIMTGKEKREASAQGNGSLMRAYHLTASEGAPTAEANRFFRRGVTMLRKSGKEITTGELRAIVNRRYGELTKYEDRKEVEKLEPEAQDVVRIMMEERDRLRDSVETLIKHNSDLIDKFTRRPRPRRPSRPRPRR